MKLKSTVLTTLFTILLISSQAQNFISITPDAGIRGTTMGTTVTSTDFFFTWSSAPTPWGDFYMKKGNSYIFPDWVNVLNDDELAVTWTIPSNATIANWDVIWEQWDFWLGTIYHYIPGGFDIADAMISGKVFNDLDSSGVLNGAEYGLGNKTILLLPDSFYTVTNNAGDYLLLSTTGNKTVHVESSPLWNHSTPSSVSVTVNTTAITGIDFGLKNIGVSYDVEGLLTNTQFPRCNTPAPFLISVVNNGNTITQGEIILNKSANTGYVYSSITPNNINGNIYTWNYTNLLPGEIRYIVVNVILPGFGQTSNSQLTITARDMQNNLMDTDMSALNIQVLCSYDPNDKSVNPPGLYPPFNYVLLNDTLDYLIRFQNTGNDTAFKVVIIDTLNTSILDINTFSIISSSHPMTVDMRSNGKTTFTFDNILLPDSNINEPGSHGYVLFRCIPKSGVLPNTVLLNKAYIYFDLNPPVITNTTLLTLMSQIPVGVASADALNVVTMMPNPFTHDALMTFKNPAGEMFTLKVFSVDGKLIHQTAVSGNKYIIKSDLLQSGLYIYELRNSSGSISHQGKFIKL